MSIPCKTCLVLPICKSRYKYYYTTSYDHKTLDALINTWYHCDILKQWFGIYEEFHFMQYFKQEEKFSDNNMLQKMMKIKGVMENNEDSL